MKTKLSALSILCTLLVVLPAVASAFNYISAEETRDKLTGQAAMTLIDIQVEKEFDQHHIVGAVATYAYPVKSAQDREKMSAAIDTLKASDAIAVIVCPRGGGGAERAYNHLVSSGIAEERVYILTKGQAAWPYPELLADNQ
ncbi:MAG: rhodanese-like domain-containing protein [Pelovirga sp.]